MAVPIEHGLVLVALLWAIGLVGLLSRKNTLFPDPKHCRCRGRPWLSFAYSFTSTYQ
jgi:hypothetical protein